MEKPDLKSLAERVKWVRLRLSLSQQELADRIGASREFITKIENGERKRPRNMEVLARALGVSQAWLLFGHDDLDKLSKEAIKMALRWQDLPPEVRDAVARMVDAASKKPE